jgi:hypothetical protein
MQMLIMYAKNVIQDVRLANITQLIAYHAILQQYIHIYIKHSVILLVQMLLIHLVVSVLTVLVIVLLVM